MKAAFEALVRKQKEVIDNGFAPGNGLICGGKNGIFYENYEGFADPENKVPVGPDTIFHLYSMTKVFTAVSTMQLIEQGKLDIDAELAEYIPEFTKIRVLENGVMRPARKRITIRMLLTMTSGISYFPTDDTGEVAALAEQWRKDLAGGHHKNTLQFAKDLAALPLYFEPGERFTYGLSHDVLGAVIELVSGKSFAAYLRNNIFVPLGMNSTFFYQDLPGELRPRLANNTASVEDKYISIPLLPKPVPSPTFAGIDDPAMYSGGAGLVGTGRDYGLFLNEMLDPKKGILRPETIAEMTRPQLGRRQRKFYNDPNSDRSIFGPEHTFGLGVRVQDREAESGSAGEWGWSGALGTWFFVSPADKVWFVYMHQHLPANHDQYIKGVRDTFYDIIKHEKKQEGNI